MSFDLVGLMLKAESTYATDSVPVVGTDGIRLASKADAWIGLAHEYMFPNERDDAVSGDLLPVAPGNPEGRLVTVTFGWEVRGKGSAYTALGQMVAAGAAIAACGYTESFAASALTFTAGDQTPSSCTIYAYGGTKLFRVVGCRGTFVVTCPAGEISTIQFTFTGMLRTAPIQSALGTITSYHTTIPPGFVNASASVGGTWSPDLVSAEYDAGVEVVRSPSANATDGIGSIDIVRHRPTVNLATKQRDISSGIDPYADADVPTARTIDWTVGAGANNKMDVGVTAAYAQPLTQDDQDGLAGWTIPYRCLDGLLRFDA